MKMDDVESRHVLKDEFHQPEMVRQGLTTIRITPKRAWADWNKLRIGFRIAAGEQRDLMAETD
jgi:hypothetical protein